jgi:hypothetical protein
MGKKFNHIRIKYLKIKKYGKYAILCVKKYLATPKCQSQEMSFQQY